MPLNAGGLDRRIRIQQRAAGKDERGQKDGAWTTFATVWAQPMPKAGREFFAASQLQAELGFIWRVRFRDDVTADMRVLDEWDTPYDVAGAPVPSGNREWLDIPCITGVRDGRG